MTTVRFDLLADFFGPGFEVLFDLGHELVGYCSVDQPMIVAQREVNDRTDRDGVIAIFVGDDHGLLHDSADAHNRGVRLIDDGEAEHGSELTWIRDRERGSFDILGLELLDASALAEIGDAALQAQEVEISGIFENGNDQSPIEGDRDSDVDVAMVADVLAFDVGVDDGPLLKRHHRGTDKERHEGKSRAVALLKSVLELVA